MLYIHIPLFASTRPVQIATHAVRIWGCAVALPPHAPCRLQPDVLCERRPTWSLPPHAPCRLQRYTLPRQNWAVPLCLHTPRADCNGGCKGGRRRGKSLPPHAPCRLQRQLATELGNVETLCLHTPRADCNGSGCAHHEESMLCLHTPRADCNTMSQ